MGKPTTSSKTPLLFQSKLLCFSLFYLCIALFLALHKSFSPKQCIVKSLHFHPVQTALFSYPPSYGEHKYALSTQRSSCSSPVFFSGFFFFCLSFCSIFGFDDCKNEFCVTVSGFCDQITEVCSITFRIYVGTPQLLARF